MQTKNFKQLPDPVRILIFLITCLGIFSGGWIIKEVTQNNSNDKARVFDGKEALELAIQQVNLGPRVPGSKAHEQVRKLIIDTLNGYSWKGEELPCEVRDGLVAQNIIAKRGTGSDWVILAAHYDSRVFADQETNVEERSIAVPGANDGASGVAVLLEIARVLPENLADSEIWLVFFDLEDNGKIPPYNEWILGSTCFVQWLVNSDQGRKPSAAIIVDMIGDADLQIFYEGTSTQYLKSEIWAKASDLGFKQFIPEEKYSIIDDHTPFLSAGIPAVDIIDFDYPYYHTLEDTVDKISAESLEAVGITIQQWLQDR